MRTLKFGGKLDLFRRKEGATIGELSRKSGVPERTLERILAGHCVPNAAHFVRLIKALDVSLDAIDAEDFEQEAI